MAVALNHDQLEKLKGVFEEALSMPSDRRSAFIRDASDGDELIQTELLSLIEIRLEDGIDGFLRKSFQSTGGKNLKPDH